MNTTTLLNTLALAGISLSLGACSACLQKNPYHGVPYTMEGTAGSGESIYYGPCPKQEKAAPVVRKEPQKAEAIFQKRQQK